MGQNITTQNTTGVTNQTQNQTQNQSGTSNFNTTVARDPYAPIIPYLNAGLNSASSNYGIWAPNFSSPELAQQTAYGIPNSWVNAGLNSQAGFANALGASSGQGQGTYATDPYFTALNRYNNPIDTATQGYLNNLNPLAANTSGDLTGVQQAILDQNAERLSNRLASLYSGSGRYGSFGAGIGLARGINETNNPLIASFNQQNIQNALNANQLAGGLYNTAQARAQQYGGMLPQFAQLGLLPGQILQNNGMFGANYGNQMLGSSIQSISPLLPLFANAGLTSTTGSAANNTLTNTSGTTSGTSNSTQETARPTPWTTYAGLGLAGLGALFPSDRRIKKDVEMVGRDPLSGLNMYKYRYKNEPWNKPKHFGPMAQEVAQKYPEKVANVGGVLHIQAA